MTLINLGIWVFALFLLTKKTQIFPQDRIAREAEQLRLERERLEAEKEEQRKKWNLQSETQSKRGNMVSETQSKQYSSAGLVTQHIVTSIAPTIQQNPQMEYVYRTAEHSPPEKLQPESAASNNKQPEQQKLNYAQERVIQPSGGGEPQLNYAQERVLGKPESNQKLNYAQEKVLSIERKEETIVQQSPYGSTTSLNDPYRRATPQGTRKSLPIQPKPNIKTELLNNKPASPLLIRVSVSQEIRVFDTLSFNLKIRCFECIYIKKKRFGCLYS